MDRPQGFFGRGRATLANKPTSQTSGSQGSPRPFLSSPSSSESSTLRQPFSRISPEASSEETASSTTTSSSFRRLQSIVASRSDSAYLSEVESKSSSDSSSKDKPFIGRGRAFFRISSSSESSSSVARGRAALLHSSRVNASKNSPVQPLSDTSSQSGVLTEAMENVRISSEPVTYHGKDKDSQQICASANWISLALDPEKVVYEYDVRFLPQVDSKNVRHKLINEVKSSLGSTKSYDGGNKLWLPFEIPQNEIKLETKNPFSGEMVQVVVRFIRKSEMWKTLQLYNVLFSRIMKVLKMTFISKGYFSQDLAIEIRQLKLEIWPGYVTAVHEMEGGVMLCVDTSHRVLRQENVYDIMRTLSAGRDKKTSQEAFIQELVGQVVMTRYNKRTYRIDDIDFELTPKSSFENEKGERMTYVEYYKNHYNIDIEDVNQALLMHKPSRKDIQGNVKFIYLIPELCSMTGLTDKMRADFRVMKDVAEYTRLTPTARQAALKKFITSVNENEVCSTILGDWGLKLVNDTVELNARVMKNEKIIFGSCEAEPSKPVDWGKQSTSESVITPVNLEFGEWMFLCPKREEPRGRKFVSLYKEVVKPMGIKVADPIMVLLQTDKIGSYIEGMKSHFKPTMKLAVVLFPNQRDDRYSAVKKFATAQLGIPTQCLLSFTLAKDQRIRSVTQKVALQINCKLGGELWAVKIPLKGILAIGIDVYHDPVRKGASVVGFVGSLNKNCTRWYSHVTFQQPGEEIVNGMKMSLIECLKAYHRENHAYPQNIVIYRDGVSEGMLRLTEEHEINQLASVLMDHCKIDETPKLYYIIVLKRISTRIFSSTNGFGVENPPPGTIVDNNITKRHWKDFFLVSQLVRQGTVSPTHYVVLRDMGLEPARMQCLTYKFTHLYYNWPGTIRVPAPCLYAHKIAYQVGQNIRCHPKENLRDRLFYL